ncbi:MAG: hypothetical protein AABM32_04695 [Chloroflexota bacterium]
MPFEGEVANKASHYDIIRNPEVTKFLDGCEYLKIPSQSEAQGMAAKFEVPPHANIAQAPKTVMAIDGSYYEASISRQFPSTRVGYVKVGAVFIDMTKMGALRVEGGRFVDPFRVAALQDDNSALTFPLPSANIRTAGKTSVRDSFRAEVDAQLLAPKTRFRDTDYKTSLRTTLFHLASSRTGPLATGTQDRLKLHRCPACGVGPVELEDIPDQQHCPTCKAEVYPSDVLRLWEVVADFQSNVEPMTRFMLQVEHMLPVHYVRHLVETSPAVLGSLAVFVDGPLAVFGQGAWLHAPILRFFGGVNAKLAAIGAPPLLVIGIQKTGQVVEHVLAIERFLPDNRVYAIDDDYRYEHILAGREASTDGFGSETYYGQDFIYKTPTGKVFVFALPYPVTQKTDWPKFAEEKIKIANYANLGRAVDLVTKLETDLYENAVIPIALAHRFTAISMRPGGRVLDVLTETALSDIKV